MRVMTRVIADVRYLNEHGMASFLSSAATHANTAELRDAVRKTFGYVCVRAVGSRAQVAQSPSA
jgi:hypothetical protein